MNPQHNPVITRTRSVEPPLTALAFFDILGIGDLMRYDYSSAANKIEHLLSIISEVERDYSNLGIEVRSFSDSIFMFISLNAILDETIEDLKQFCRVISLIQSKSLPEEIPLSGAISIGKTITIPRNRALNSQYISCRAVWEVVKWELAQKWVGISFVPLRIVSEDTSSGLYYQRNNYYENALNKLMDQDLILKYRIPVSGKLVRGNTAEVHALCWTKSQLNHLETILNGVMAQITDPSIKPRYETTLRFIKHQIRRGVGP